MAGALLVPLRGYGGKVKACAWIDEEDADLGRYRWCFNGDYAVRAGHDGEGRRGERVYLHREVLGLEYGDGKIADHINLNTLDCRRSNLRLATKGENGQNLPAAQGTSKHRGVSFHKRVGRWQASVQLDGRSNWLGYFDSEDEAAEAAAAWRREHMPYAND